MQLSRVRDACAEFLRTRLSPKNVLGVLHFAEALGCSALANACKQYAYKWFEQVSEGDEFTNLNFDQVHELVMSDELNLAAEEVVFRAILMWIKHDLSNREKHLPDLLACVRMPLIRPQILSDEIATEELVRSSLKCR